MSTHRKLNLRKTKIRTLTPSESDQVVGRDNPPSQPLPNTLDPDDDSCMVCPSDLCDPPDSGTCP